MRFTSSGTSFRAFIQTVGILPFFASRALGQDFIIGEDRCGCSPPTYQFTLYFSLFCPPINLTPSDSVASASCLISPFGDPSVSDLVPVVVNQIDVIELGQDISILVQEIIDGDFLDGDVFDYESITNTPEKIVESSDVPRSLQLNLIGENTLGEELINVFIITFTNDCDAYPVITESQSAGWTVFVSHCHGMVYILYTVAPN
jgi:hypothetical protein